MSRHPGIHLGLVTCVKGFLRLSQGPDQKFVIFGQARTGSSLLVNLLNSNPDIHCDGELLQERILLSRYFVRAKALLSPKRIYGFKLLSYQIQNVQKLCNPSAFIRDLDSHNFKFLYLQRRNVLRKQLSNLYAHNTRVFHIRRGETAQAKQKVYVAPKDLFTWIKESEKLKQFEMAALKNIHYLPLYYEDDLLDQASHQATVDRISDFLEIPRCSASTDMIKVTPLHFPDFIENYEEIIQFISQTEYSKFLDYE